MFPLADIATLPAQLWTIFHRIVLPILLLAGIGYALQRTLTLDMPTLRRLNFYFIIPAIIYVNVVTSKLGGAGVALVVGFTVALWVTMAGLTLLLAWLRGVPRDQRAALLLTTVLHNSGNYGLPLQKLAFRPYGLGDRAVANQTFVMITQNFITFTLGILIVGGGGRNTWRQNVRHMLRFPPIYALAAALITTQIVVLLGDAAGPVRHALRPLWDVLVYVKGAFVALALVTLGAQLALVGKEAAKYRITMSVFLRLLGGPALALGLIHLADAALRAGGGEGLSPFLAQLLLISSTTPTAVNCMLMCLEFENHPDLAARAVLYSTLLSPITVTLVIFFARGEWLPLLSGLGA